MYKGTRLMSGEEFVGLDGRGLERLARDRQEHLQKVYLDAVKCREARDSLMRVKVAQMKHARSFGEFREAIEHLDRGMIVCGATEEYLDIIDELESGLELSMVDFSLPKEDKMDSIQVRELPKEDLQEASAWIVKDQMRDWPALSLWSNVSYLLRVAGHRFVPVEIGSSYADDPGWRQEIMSLHQFFERFVAEQRSVVEQGRVIGYVAQFDLLAHVRGLAGDVGIPGRLDGCGFFRNCWVGPEGTYTPLHRDPQDNLFCQVVGYKEVWMVPESDSCCGERVVLGPGDSLFIPKGWWHRVRSLSFSISISHWIQS